MTSLQAAALSLSSAPGFRCSLLLLPALSPTEGAHALALALALGPEVAAHAAKARAALGELHLGVGAAEISPTCAPVATVVRITKTDKKQLLCVTGV